MAIIPAMPKGSAAGTSLSSSLSSRRQTQLFENGRGPQFFENGRCPIVLYLFENIRRPQLFDTGKRPTFFF